jgi:sugar phosphate isomerase/epimerase
VNDGQKARQEGAPMPRPGPLSLNIATVRERWGLAECVEGCARHGISGIAPWRDALADAGGAQRAARRIRAAGLAVSSLCRTGRHCQLVPGRNDNLQLRLNADQVERSFYISPALPAT